MPPNIEPILWLVIFVICAVVLAKLHGFLVSLLDVTVAHIAFADADIAGHPDEAAASAQSGLPVRVRGPQRVGMN